MRGRRGIARAFDVEGYVDREIGVVSRSTGKHGAELICVCPFCGRPKLYVNVESGLWVCYRCAPKGGTVIDLVAKTQGIPRSQAREIVADPKSAPGESLERIAERAAASLDEEARHERRIDAPRVSLDVGLPDEFVPIFDAASGTWRIPDYCRERGIRGRTARAYGLGYCTGGRYGGRLIFPAHVFGETVTFQGRIMRPLADDEHVPKYLGPSVEKSVAVYGLDEAIGVRRVALVEGPIDVVKLYQFGVPAVALMGKSASMGQATTLSRAGFRSIDLLLDADDPGIEARADAVAVLGLTFDVRLAFLPYGVDPGSATRDQVEDALALARAPKLSETIGRSRKAT